MIKPRIKHCRIIPQIQNMILAQKELQSSSSYIAIQSHISQVQCSPSTWVTFNKGHCSTIYRAGLVLQTTEWPWQEQFCYVLTKPLIRAVNKIVVIFKMQKERKKASK
jgi:hypothetical protein